MEYKLFIDGQWVNAGPIMEVKNKYNGQTIAALPTARREDVDAAIAAAERAAQVMADMPAHKRAEILLRPRRCCGSVPKIWRRPLPRKRARHSSLHAPRWIVPSAHLRLRRKR